MQKLKPLFLVLLFLAQTAWAQTFYVSPQGNDGWSGIQPDGAGADNGGPFASLPQALQASRDWKQANPDKPAKIFLRQGTYYLDTTLDLFGVDSGLTLAAYPGESPVISGGRRITGWEKAGDHLWEAPVPEARNGTWDFRVLAVNGEWRPRARLPETGYFTHLSRFDVRWMSTTGGGWQVKPTQEQLTRLQYQPGDIEAWMDLNNAEVAVYHMWDMSMMKPVSIDSGTNTLIFAYPGEHPPGAFGISNYLVWNVKEGLKEPGQWYLDRTRGKVVYWPRPGEDMDKAVVMAPGPANLIRVSGYKDQPVSNISLENLTLTLANAPLNKGGVGSKDVEGAVQMSYTLNCSLAGLRFDDLAGWAVQAKGSDGLTVKDCRVVETGAGGIHAEGAGVVVSGNWVEKIGLIYPSGNAIDVEKGLGAQILRNTIKDCPYDGILNMSGNSLIGKNLIDSVMRELHDGGGIYSGFCQGVTIRGNWVMNVTNMGGYGSSAYYLDEQSTGCLEEDNLSVNVTRPSQNHMAHDNTLRHNFFIVEGDGQMDFARCKGYTLENNVIDAQGKFTFSAPAEGITSMPDNLIYCAQGQVTLKTLLDYNPQGTADFAPRDGTLLADPRLENPKPGVYGFAPGSPALKLGIAPLDDSDAGSSIPDPK